MAAATFKELKKEIKQTKKQILSLLIIVFMFVMTFSGMKVGMAANEGTTSLAQNITAGTLDVVVNTTLEWADIQVPSVATNSDATLSGVNASDDRGTLAGWDLTVYSNNLQAGDNQLNVSNRLYVEPGDVTSASNAAAGVPFNMPLTAGTAATFLSAAADNGWAGSNIDNSLFRLRIEPTDQAGDYTATMTFTIS